MIRAGLAAALCVALHEPGAVAVEAVEAVLAGEAPDDVPDVAPEDDPPLACAAIALDSSASALAPPPQAMIAVAHSSEKHAARNR